VNINYNFKNHTNNLKFNHKFNYIISKKSVCCK